MRTRRYFLMGLGSFAGATLSVRADDLCAAFTKDAQAGITSEQALERLKAGNARFVAGHPIHCNPQLQVKATAGGQAPFAAVLSCMDSRTAPELVFDQRIGDIFAVRIAGNFVNTDILGSLEYATQVAGAKLIVVLGHSDCGAVKGAIDHVQLGNLTAALENIRPAVSEVTDAGGPRDSKNKKFVQRVSERNVTDAVSQLTTRSKILAGLVSKHKLLMVGAMHDVSTGAVSWLGDQAA
ncbi:MAG TPA: carbonic anhydrase family protein [Steroidobacteraceae bacterium]|nr:carbonic anhydrase family protein [Steroidobacteraceae bacterium]